MARTEDLKIKIFADGATLDSLAELKANPLVKGYTLNPSLMRQAGVDDYEAFARSFLELITDQPVSLQVIADDFEEMRRQAERIASWAPNTYVKIPITTTGGQSSVPLIRQLSSDGVRVNVTAMMPLQQVSDVAEALHEDTDSIVSVFAGRIADTGVDPMPHMSEAVNILKSRPRAELLWASPRELLNIFQADEVGCHIITVTKSLLDKLSNVGKDLDQFSRETVEMFYNDALKTGYRL